MHAINRSLLALALCALFAPPAFAGDKDPPAHAKAPTTTPAKASDAVSARSTQRESGRMADSPVKTNTAAATTNPGKGNWWADADVDGDGQLSAAEAKSQASLSAEFGNVDSDGDGYVTSEEYRHFFTTNRSQGEEYAAPHSAVVTRDVWSRLDSNDDGKLSATEVKADASISGSFSGMDANGDGFVTEAEYRTYAKAHLQK